jgi:excisionase family DNA binding protein
MAAYALHQREPVVRDHPSASSLTPLPSLVVVAQPGSSARQQNASDVVTSLAILDQLLDAIAARVAAAITARLTADPERGDEWLDSRHAAEYLGVHRDTLRKLAAERTIQYEQDGPGCKLYFRRSDLDAWRRTGGRPRHLASSLAAAG